jgi:hypothetical protein
MTKIKLGIDINEILRAKWLQFDRFYVQEHGFTTNENGDDVPNGVTTDENGQFNTYDYLNHYEFKQKDEDVFFLKDENEVPEDISPMEYIVDEETGVAPIDKFITDKETTTFTPQQLFERFMYDEYVYEIHGSAPKTYQNADVDMFAFMVKYKEYFEYVLVSKEKATSVSPTLFFLSKLRLNFKEIFFANNDSEIWSKVDWMLTTDPGIISSKGENQKAIKVATPYNVDVTADFETMAVAHLEDEAWLANDFTEFVKNNIKQ